MLTVVLVLLGLILLNGVFVAAEFAIVATPRTSIERLAAHGNSRARRVAKILHDPLLQDRYIATAQLGITAASLALGMYGELQLAEFFGKWLGQVQMPSWIGAHGLASAVAIIVLTYFHVVLGEMVPKALALGSTERVVLMLQPLMRSVQFALFPIIVVLSRAGDLVLRLFGVARREQPEHFMTSEELRYVVRESGESGLIETEAAHVLEQLFDFGRRTAREIMVPRVNISALALDLSPEAFSKHLLRDPHTRYPVYEDDVDHVIGAVHIRELMKCVREKRAIDPSDLTPTPFVPETASLNDLLTIMRERRAYLVIVMDEHGGTAGLITLEDLFAELVGVIPESKEDASDSIVEHPSGTLEVEGTVRVDALGQHLGMELVHEEVDTVSGLVLSLLKREPRIGDVVEFDGVQLEVLAVAGHGVTKCRVTIPEPAPLNRSPA